MQDHCPAADGRLRHPAMGIDRKRRRIVARALHCA
jgi:hypothetical protein